jgi:hypothetical protein
MFSKLCLVAVVAAALPMAADVITTDPNLPPNVGAYVSGNQQTCFTSCAVVDLTDIILGDFSSIVRTPSGSDEIESFNAVATAMASFLGGSFVPVTLSGSVQMTAFNKIGNTTGTFSTQVTGLNLSGGGAMLRQSPTLASDGETTVTDIGGGEFQIHSFFDVFVELSLDDGTTWTPSIGPTHKELTSSPEPAAGLLTAAGLAIGILFRGIRRAAHS